MAAAAVIKAIAKAEEAEMPAKSELEPARQEAKDADAVDNNATLDVTSLTTVGQQAHANLVSGISPSLPPLRLSDPLILLIHIGGHPRPRVASTNMDLHTLFCTYI